MGDRIAILGEQAHVAQYDTPETILTDPSGEFVEDFIGSGATIKRLSLSRVSDIEPADWPVVGASTGEEEARRIMRDSGRDYVLLLDSERRPQRWIGTGDIERNGSSLPRAGRPVAALVKADASLYDTLDSMITSYKGSAVVIDENGAYQGVVDFDTVLAAIEEMRPAHEESTGEQVRT